MMETKEGNGPLAGIKVIDVSRLAPGPMTAMILGDLGADVIKVEEPGGGRRARDESKLMARRGPSHRRADNRSSNPLERNKRSIALNLKHPKGRAIALQLFANADVVVEGFRPGVMARLGLDYETVRSVNPHLIYCSITGYGQTGPRSERVGHDLNYQADAGALALFGALGCSTPVVPPNLLGDYAGGTLQAVTGILAALLARVRHGQGQHVDVSITDGTLALLTLEIASFKKTGELPRPGYTRLTGGMAHYNVYETKDGRQITIGCNEPAFFRNLCEVLGLEHLISGQLDFGMQTQNRNEFVKAFKELTASEIESLFAGKDIAYAFVRGLNELEHDEHYRYRGMFQRVEASTEASVQVASPFHFSHDQTSIRLSPPEPGAQTEEILRDLGYSDVDLPTLFTYGTIASAEPPPNASEDADAIG